MSSISSPKRDVVCSTSLISLPFVFFQPRPVIFPETETMSSTFATSRCSSISRLAVSSGHVAVVARGMDKLAECPRELCKLAWTTAIRLERQAVGRILRSSFQGSISTRDFSKAVSLNLQKVYYTLLDVCRGKDRRGEFRTFPSNADATWSWLGPREITGLARGFFNNVY